jgi:hypothetical protein
LVVNRQYDFIHSDQDEDGGTTKAMKSTKFRPFMLNSSCRLRYYPSKFSCLEQACWRPS